MSPELCHSAHVDHDCYRTGFPIRWRFTETLSCYSDRVFAPLVKRSAQKYASTIGTPEHFVEMLFLVEDKRFPVHFGMDPIAVARALVFNARGGPLQGASTISQQIYTVRNRRRGKVSRSFGHKLKQMSWSLAVSAFRSKQAILREYVDTVYWGKSYYGLDEAAKGYFNKARTALSPAQSFFLAERLATPNRVSMQRIWNLLNRNPIILTLHRNSAALADVVEVYDKIFDCGGELCQVLAK